MRILFLWLISVRNRGDQRFDQTGRKVITAPRYEFFLRIEFEILSKNHFLMLKGRVCEAIKGTIAFFCPLSSVNSSCSGTFMGSLTKVNFGSLFAGNL
jgi:hypothetical protein